MYDEFNETTDGTFGMPDHVDNDNDDVFANYGEGFEDEMIAAEKSTFMNKEDEYEHDFAKAESGDM